MNRVISFIGSTSLAALFMYLLDPDNGKKRRSLIRDKAVKALNEMDDGIGKAGRDLRNRTRGVVAEILGALSEKETPDWLVEERIRAKLGRLAQFPGLIEVRVQQNHVVLIGSVLANEAERVIQMVSSLPGVAGVENRLDVYQEAAEIPGMQNQPQPFERLDWRQRSWSPSARLLTGVGGTSLYMYGRRRGGIFGSALRLLGCGFAIRGLTNHGMKRLFGVGKEQPAISVHKTITIDAPVEQIYEFWSNFQNFPRFMEHVREVQPLSDGRSHWTVSGPAGVPIEWEAIITRQIPNDQLAWKSAPEAPVKTSGLVQFQPNPDGSTRLDIHMSYTPPAGDLGHAVATFLGANPKQAMDEDLMRFKFLMEQGKTTVHGEKVTLENAADNNNEEETPKAKPRRKRAEKDLIES